MNKGELYWDSAALTSERKDAACVARGQNGQNDEHEISMKPERPLALFDLDGTLTRRDTLSDLLVRHFGVKRCITVGIRVLPQLLGVPLNLVHRDVAKVHILQQFFGGMPDAEFQALSANYAVHHLHKLLRPQARERLDWHKAAGHRVIVISASVVDWIRPWTELEGIEVIATELERNDGLVTGNLEGPNCRGQEKVNRLRAHLTLDDYHPIYAYGDTAGDTEMLAMADHAVYRGLR